MVITTIMINSNENPHHHLQYSVYVGGGVIKEAMGVDTNRKTFNSSHDRSQQYKYFFSLKK